MATTTTPQKNVEQRLVYESLEAVQWNFGGSSGGGGGEAVEEGGSSALNRSGGAGSGTRVQYSCMDASADYLIFGTNTGTLYVFERATLRFLKLLSSLDIRAPISQVRISPSQTLFAIATGSLVYIVKPNLNRERRRDKDKVYAKISAHLDSSSSSTSLSSSGGSTTPSSASAGAPLVTCMLWSKSEGLFSGDSNGVILLTRFQKGKPAFSEFVFKADSAIVQMDYCPHLPLLLPSAAQQQPQEEAATGNPKPSLLVSTLTRCLLLALHRAIGASPQQSRPLHGTQSLQIGKKLRNGVYGACILQSSASFASIPPSAALSAIATRPGKRLWVVESQSARVLKTLNFKASIASIPPSTFHTADSASSIQPSPALSAVAFSKVVPLRGAAAIGEESLPPRYILCWDDASERAQNALCLIDLESVEIVAWTCFWKIEDLAFVDGCIYLLHWDGPSSAQQQPTLENHRTIVSRISLPTLLRPLQEDKKENATVEASSPQYYSQSCAVKTVEEPMAVDVVTATLASDEPIEQSGTSTQSHSPVLRETSSSSSASSSSSSPSSSPSSSAASATQDADGTLGLSAKTETLSGHSGWPPSPPPDTLPTSSNEEREDAASLAPPVAAEEHLYADNLQAKQHSITINEDIPEAVVVAPVPRKREHTDRRKKRSGTDRKNKGKRKPATIVSISDPSASNMLPSTNLNLPLRGNGRNSGSTTVSHTPLRRAFSTSFASPSSSATSSPSLSSSSSSVPVAHEASPERDSSSPESPRSSSPSPRSQSPSPPPISLAATTTPTTTAATTNQQPLHNSAPSEKNTSYQSLPQGHDSPLKEQPSLPNEHQPQQQQQQDAQFAQNLLMEQETGSLPVNMVPKMDAPKPEGMVVTPTETTNSSSPSFGGKGLGFGYSLPPSLTSNFKEMQKNLERTAKLTSEALSLKKPSLDDLSRMFSTSSSFATSASVTMSTTATATATTTSNSTVSANVTTGTTATHSSASFSSTSSSTLPDSSFSLEKLRNNNAAASATALLHRSVSSLSAFSSGKLYKWQQDSPKEAVSGDPGNVPAATFHTDQSEDKKIRIYELSRTLFELLTSPVPQSQKFNPAGLLSLREWAALFAERNRASSTLFGADLLNFLPSSWLSELLTTCLELQIGEELESKDRTSLEDKVIAYIERYFGLLILPRVFFACNNREQRRCIKFLLFLEDCCLQPAPRAEAAPIDEESSSLSTSSLRYSAGPLPPNNLQTVYLPAKAVLSKLDRLLKQQAEQEETGTQQQQSKSGATKRGKQSSEEALEVLRKQNSLSLSLRYLGRLLAIASSQAVVRYAVSNYPSIQPWNVMEQLLLFSEESPNELRSSISSSSFWLSSIAPSLWRKFQQHQQQNASDDSNHLSFAGKFKRKENIESAALQNDHLFDELIQSLNRAEKAHIFLLYLTHLMKLREECREDPLLVETWFEYCLKVNNLPDDIDLAEEADEEKHQSMLDYPSGSTVSRQLPSLQGTNSCRWKPYSGNERLLRKIIHGCDRYVYSAACLKDLCRRYGYYYGFKELCLRLHHWEEAVDAILQNDDWPSFHALMRTDTSLTHWDLILHKMNDLRSENEKLPPCSFNISKEQVVSMMVICLGANKCMEILHSNELFSSGISPSIYASFIRCIQTDIKQKELHHQMLNILLEYFWSDKKVKRPPTIAPQFNLLRKKETKHQLHSGDAVNKELPPFITQKQLLFLSPSDQPAEGSLDLVLDFDYSTPVPSFFEEMTVGHWGARLKYQTCPCCTLPLMEKMTSIPPTNVVVFPCGHAFHLFCCPEEACPSCYAQNVTSLRNNSSFLRESVASLPPEELL